MIPLKYNFSFLISDDDGAVHKSHPSTGAYYFDTRMLSQYRWTFEDYRLLHKEFDGSSKLTQRWSLFQQHKQTLLIERRLTILERGFEDELIISNDDIDSHDFSTLLDLDTDFVDMFEVRNREMPPFDRVIHKTVTPMSYQAEFTAQDEKKFKVTVTIQGASLNEVITLQPKTQRVLKVFVEFSSDIDDRMSVLNVEDRWLGSDTIKDLSGVYRQAEKDLRDLLLATSDGLTIAAGIPWFVTPFGRDSLITAWFLLDRAPQLAEGVLRYLAVHQGKEVNPFRDEEPGKIMHELRYGEASRLDILPFRTYYGTADATPLFLMLLHDYCQKIGSYALVDELQTEWQAAIHWMDNFCDHRGLIVFKGNEAGLAVQSWKDSHDSLSYADGRLGEGKLAVAEVQGYAYAAYLAGAQFYDQQNDYENAQICRQKAHRLQESFLSLFWMETDDNFAIAIDENNQQLNINSSDTGHLLWSGIVPAALAGKVINRLFKEDLWSGWGLRTLSSQEVRYNPLSYHNGSVWPHDTGIFAAGLKRYGYQKQFQIVCSSLKQLAETQPDLRLPELLGGYSRGSQPVLPYIEACRPQAWSAAALIFAMSQDS